MTGCCSSRRRRRPSSPSPVALNPLEDDDLLHEILLRLPPQSPYLLRASIVSKRWRCLATDPKFLLRFRIHHAKPPLLGFFTYEYGEFSFRSTLDPPYRIPPDGFSLRFGGRDQWRLLDCRHGRVLFLDYSPRQVIVWDPITDECRVVAYPPQFHGSGIRGAVLCAAGDQGHVHGACHSSPFKVVIVGTRYENDYEAVTFASIYSSESRIWSDIISTAFQGMGTCISHRSTLVGNTLHWLLRRNNTSTGILEFGLDTARLAVIKMPPGVHHAYKVQIIQAEDGGVGFAALSGHRYKPRLQIWERKVDSYGVATWVLQKAAKLRKILGLGFRIDKKDSIIMRYVEDVHSIFLRVHQSVYTIQLESMEPKELFKYYHVLSYHPFTSFYAEVGLSELYKREAGTLRLV